MLGKIGLRMWIKVQKLKFLSRFLQKKIGNSEKSHIGRKRRGGKNKFLFITYGNGPSFKFKNKYISKLINSYEIKKEYIVPEL